LAILKWNTLIKNIETFTSREWIGMRLNKEIRSNRFSSLQ